MGGLSLVSKLSLIMNHDHCVTIIFCFFSFYMSIHSINAFYIILPYVSHFLHISTQVSQFPNRSQQLFTAESTPGWSGGERIQQQLDALGGAGDLEPGHLRQHSGSVS